MLRLADTQVPINPTIARRWSPRAFDPRAVVTADQVIALLEAARWAATWGRRQPVRFVVGIRGDATFVALAGLLNPGNSYAKAASALILVCADQGDNDRTATYSALDAGAAIAQLSIEAQSRSLVVHPMAGFDVAAAHREFDIPNRARPLAIVAAGFLGDYTDVDPEIARRDGAPRRRLPLRQIAFARRWGQAFEPAPGTHNRGSAGPPQPGALAGS
ncbi:nitroreductase [Mycobacterium simiae]|uniref:Nitroreductase n=1 Tax=Mycobacterium simiae TaxID=1784 RepID=A0A5B1BT00_MYCSI|nr:nitroreductase family protein [Mycobacterium simiae]KAA1251807.1 nitroreductase [Mycobacterium simiae]